MPASRKSPRLKTAVRKTVKWGGTGLTVLLAVVWIGSGRWHAKWDQSNSGAVVIVGLGQLHLNGPVSQGRWSDYQLVEFGANERDYRFEWWFYRDPGRWLAVPLWLPALLSLLATAASAMARASSAATTGPGLRRALCARSVGSSPRRDRLRGWEVVETSSATR